MPSGWGFPNTSLCLFSIFSNFFSVSSDSSILLSDTSNVVDVEATRPFLGGSTIRWSRVASAPVIFECSLFRLIISELWFSNPRLDNRSHPIRNWFSPGMMGIWHFKCTRGERIRSYSKLSMQLAVSGDWMLVPLAKVNLNLLATIEHSAFLAMSSEKQEVSQALSISASKGALRISA
ncbi:hypothetical protein GEMRC1_012243 [Eukaryota sp. GEM-RC1]